MGLTDWETPERMARFVANPRRGAQLAAFRVLRSAPRADVSRLRHHWPPSWSSSTSFPGKKIFPGLLPPGSRALRGRRVAPCALPAGRCDEHGFFVERAHAERTPALKQIIPYSVVVRGGNVLLLHAHRSGAVARRDCTTSSRLESAVTSTPRTPMRRSPVASPADRIRGGLADARSTEELDDRGPLSRFGHAGWTPQ